MPNYSACCGNYSPVCEKKKAVTGVYDILQKDDQGVLWIGVEPSMEQVLTRVREHSHGSGEYIILHQKTGETTTIHAEQVNKSAGPPPQH